MVFGFSKGFCKVHHEQVRLSVKGELILKFETVLHNVSRMKLPTMPGTSILSEGLNAASGEVL